jgi:hypothetical protein
MVNMVAIPADSFVATALFFNKLSIGDDLKSAKRWKQTFVDIPKEYPHYARALASATTVAQLESKLWIINELKTLNIKPKVVGILAGWYSNFLTPLLLENLGVDFIWNFEMDRDVKELSYKFNKKYKDQNKYHVYITDIMFDDLMDNSSKNHLARCEETRGPYDIFINTSCEHMWPMSRFRDLNCELSNDPLYVLQSTDDDQYEEHINCVSGPEELAKQANFTEILYSGTKVLDSGMNRFMVIGK